MGSNEWCLTQVVAAVIVLVPTQFSNGFQLVCCCSVAAEGLH